MNQVFSTLLAAVSPFVTPLINLQHVNELGGLGFRVRLSNPYTHTHTHTHRGMHQPDLSRRECF